MSVIITVITNRKLHMGFRFIPNSMTLNDVIALILRFFTEFDTLLANYITVVEDRRTMSAKYCLAVPV